MCYAIPSNLRILETNGDGNADRLYFGDLGGQLWRVDFDDVTKSDDYNVRLLADVSASGYQPFYYPPSVSLQAGSKNNFYAVTIGSGNRDNPLADLSEGALYMLRDEINNTDTAHTITVSDLYEKSGWLIKLKPGEKILSETLILENNIVATTYTPDDDDSIGTCGAPTATNRLLAAHLTDAGPSKYLTDESLITTPMTGSERFKELSAQGIASQPQLVYSKDESVAQLFVGKEKVAIIPPVLHRLMWYLND